MIAVVSEIISLLQTAISLADKKAELDQKYFEQFIQPAWDAFKKVHEDYKISFSTYIELLSKGDCDINELIEKIRNDSIQTEDMRKELSQILNNLPKGLLFKASGNEVAYFAQSIVFYFHVQPKLYRINLNNHDNKEQKVGIHTADKDLSSYFYIEQNKTPPTAADDETPKYALITENIPTPYTTINAIRFQAIIFLSRSGEVGEESKKFLDRSLMSLQWRYGEVAGAYQRLRTSLLA